MALLSALPGRIRFENKHLIGRLHICGYMQEHVNNYVKGISEITANYRTGRVLVKFDEKRVDRQTIIQYIHHVTKEYREKMNSDSLSLKKKNLKLPITTIINHPLMETVVRATFPKPLNVFVPMAMKVMIGKN